MIGDLFLHALERDGDLRRDLEAFLAQIKQDWMQELVSESDVARMRKLQGKIEALDTITSFCQTKQPEGDFDARRSRSG